MKTKTFLEFVQDKEDPMIISRVTLGDGNDFKPYSFEEIKIIMNRKSHHIEEKLSQSNSDKYKSIHESI